ncbi:MAG: response regulator transcription factor [Bacteroidia bacterium]|nr:response regulator transcription factor [Bacteroidia bacterium]
MLRAIIVDDEMNGVETLRMLIESLGEDVKIVAESTNPLKSKELIENYKPEIVFLDINMPGMTGFELLDNLAWKNFNLIFTTAHQEYAVRALKNNAIDYLLKPVDRQELLAAILKIKNKITESQNTAYNYNELFQWLKPAYDHKLLIYSKTGVEHINASSILYLESHSNYTSIFTMDGREITTTKTLKEFESQLCVSDSGFMRIHHSFIVNLNHVVRYLKGEETVLTVNEHSIPISRSKKKMFHDWLKI